MVSAFFQVGMILSIGEYRRFSPNFCEQCLGVGLRGWFKRPPTDEMLANGKFLKQRELANRSLLGTSRSELTNSGDTMTNSKNRNRPAMASTRSAENTDRSAPQATTNPPNHNNDHQHHAHNHLIPPGWNRSTPLD
jgi:hypothetical protein